MKVEGVAVEMEADNNCLNNEAALEDEFDCLDMLAVEVVVGALRLASNKIDLDEKIQSSCMTTDELGFLTPSHCSIP